MIIELLRDITRDFPSNVEIPRTGRVNFLPVPEIYFLRKEDSTSHICLIVKSVDIDDWYAATSDGVLYFSQFIMRAALEHSESMLDSGLVTWFVNGLTYDELSIDLCAFNEPQLKLILRFLAELVKLDPQEDSFEHARLQRVSMETLKRKAQEKPMPHTEVMRRLELNQIKPA